MIAASVKARLELGASLVKHKISNTRTSVESPGKSLVARTTGSQGHLALAAGRVLGHTGSVEERGRRLRGRYVRAGRENA